MRRMKADAPVCGIGADIKEAKATSHHARSSLRHGNQLDDMAVVVLVIEAAAAIPIVELSVFKAPGPASEGEPTVLDPLQDCWTSQSSRAPLSGHLNSRPIDGSLGGPTNTIGMNQFGTVTLGCGSTAPLDAFPSPARTDCRWHVSRCRQASVSRK